MKFFAKFNPLLFICAAVLAGAVIFLPACSQAPSGRTADPADFALTVLHTNDIHSTYGGTTDQGLTCYAALCEGGRGGYVRLDQAVRAVRRDRPEALFMDAGDTFQGTLFWTLHKERMPAALIDRIGYQAVIPGNHAFDDGWPTWLRLVKRLKTPVLAANISFDARPEPATAKKLKPYIVLERGGRKIGVVGLLTQNTPETSSPGPGINFGDARAALESAVEELTAQGVNIIIALTHLGLEDDRRLARAVKGVDLIVGGHSHSFLSDRDKKAEGPYPIVEKAPDRKPVLVVSAATACAYLGRIDLGFDAGGALKSWRGEPIPLDQAGLAAIGAPAPDAALIKLVDGFAAPVQKMIKTRLGTISADGRAGRPLEEPNVMECRRGECLTGNVVADSLRALAFSEARIALVNGGALRNSLPGGQVTPGDVLATLPFQNTPLKTKMSGAVILEALEHGVATYGEGEGSFLQVAGLRYAFKPSNKPGRRITRAETLAEDGQWQPLDKNSAYQVVTLDFLARGGDGFAMFKSLDWEEGERLANDVLRVYLEKHSPVKAELQNRITVQR